jgi:cellulose biosynthesis protein BcsQ
MLAKAAKQRKADVVLIDVAPSLGALNRAALIAATDVVIPLVPDLYSAPGMGRKAEEEPRPDSVDA